MQGDPLQRMQRLPRADVTVRDLTLVEENRDEPCAFRRPLPQFVDGHHQLLVHVRPGTLLILAGETSNEEIPVGDGSPDSSLPAYPRHQEIAIQPNLDIERTEHFGESGHRRTVLADVRNKHVIHRISTSPTTRVIKAVFDTPVTDVGHAERSVDSS